jgi:hypothetical protein
MESVEERNGAAEGSSFSYGLPERKATFSFLYSNCKDRCFIETDSLRSDMYAFVSTEVRLPRRALFLEASCRSPSSPPERFSPWLSDAPRGSGRAPS